MKKLYKSQKKNLFTTSSKLAKLCFLIENSQKTNTLLGEKSVSLKALSVSENCVFSDAERSKNISTNFSLSLQIIEKPINLLFSIDQFLFEFSKKTYQQRKSGEFSQQLKERKKLSLFYGHLTQKQINNLFNKVKRKKGSFSKNIFSTLERRLDVILYRSGLLKTITQARQCIKHKKIFVNSHLINIPSYLLNPGDVVSIKSKTSTDFAENLLKKAKKKHVKNHPKILGDFYDKLTQNLDLLKKSSGPLDSLKKTENFLSFSTDEKKQSRVLCQLFVQFLCTRMKLRSFFKVKKVLLNSEKFLLALFKMKLSDSALKKNLNETESQNSQVLPNFKNVRESKKNSQEFFDTLGRYLKQKPLFWAYRMEHFSQKTVLDSVEKTTSSFVLKQTKEIEMRKRVDLKKNTLLISRKNFFFFLKSLNNSKKFTHLVVLNFKKMLFRSFFSKQKVFFLKTLDFRMIKATHFEVSYNLLNLIYLYTPQRINFPFFIDLDLIKRSLR